ncbi:NAD-dependent epimerase/dehydratase family protein [Sphingomonas flavalba]|uniref:NAD-dependent epimerase/dehydratase family protein n=1 Tax=Sphingomonas flavalba TaxID=2559804 RepID=UPI0039E0B08A
MITVAVTGASGFIGTAVLSTLPALGIQVRGISRQEREANLFGADWCRVDDYADIPGLTSILRGADIVLHLADNPERGRTDGDGAAAAMADALISAMRLAGTRRVIVASSVYAREVPTGGSYPYARIKRTIENRFLAAGDLQSVILRLPPVYGAGGKGGFGQLASLVLKGLPLPFGGAGAKRAYLSRNNLVDLLAAICAADEAAWDIASGKCFEPSDGAPVSTRDLVRMIAVVTGKPARLLAVPIPLLRLIGKVSGHAHVVEGAVGALQLADISELEALFGWRPAETMPESLSFLQEHGAGAA